MNIRPQLFASCLALSVLASSSASAHFQLLQIDDYMQEKGGTVTVNMPFTHPSHGGPMMDMQPPESLTVTHRGKTTDLTSSLTSLKWHGPESDAIAYQAPAKLRSMGDYTFNFVPAPYLETSEDSYIQQFTKTVVNVGGLPTGWSDVSNAPAEIIPDQTPYAVYAGGLFSGVVMANGEPQAGIDVEVELINHVVNADNTGFVDKPLVEYPRENLNIITLRTDDNGRFFFGVPVAGYWGFAALGVGKQKTYKGKALSQDAVLWIQAHELKKVK